MAATDALHDPFNLVATALEMGRASGCLVVLLVFGALIAGVTITIVGKMMKSSDAYTQAVARAHRAPAVRAALGEPIREGRFVSGNVRTDGTSGRAWLAIPLSGPKASGTLYEEASKRFGAWNLDALVFEDAQHRRDDLLAAPPRGGDTDPR